MKAADRRQVNVLQELFNRGANINLTDQQGQTALIRAVMTKDMTTVVTLVTQGIAVNTEDIHGMNAYAIAQQLGNLAIANFLQNFINAPYAFAPTQPHF